MSELADELERIDIDAFLAGDRNQCLKLRAGLETQSVILFRDSRVPDPEVVLKMMTQYFAQDPRVLRRDARPKLHHQVGITPPFAERARDHSLMWQSWPRELWPHIPSEGFRDPKWRFMHQVVGEGVQPTCEPVIPREFEGCWQTTLDPYTKAKMESVYTIAIMLADAYDLPHDTFLRMIKTGTHFYAPNGIRLDLPEIVIGFILNAFHFDLNWGTAHSRASAPGLVIWYGGKKMKVRVPKGWFLFQGGKQLEWMTGGRIKAGFHEVVILPETLEARDQLIAQGLPPARATATIFAESDLRRLLHVIEAFLPTDPFMRKQVLTLYPPVPVSYQVLRELFFIGLAKKHPRLEVEMDNLYPGERELALAA